MDLLVNWLWQGGAVALAATVILRASRRMSATTRYNLWWITLVVVLSIPALAWVSTMALASRADAARPLTEAFAATGAAYAPAPAAGVILPAAPAWVAAAFAALWLLWLSVSIARLVSAGVAVRRIRGATRAFPEGREERLPVWLSVRGDGRPVGLTLSDGVRAASVIGLAAPTIAVAPRALDALTDAELDQIVVHEWAHVQRGDAVGRLIQRLVAAVAGLHPAIWWIDRQLDLERETACDDWAIRASGSGRGLAVCLTKLASLPGRDTGGALSPAALVSSDLSIRVTRLLDGRRNTSTRPALGVPMVVTTLLAALAVGVASVELVVTAPLPGIASEHAALLESTVDSLRADAAVAAASRESVPVQAAPGPARKRPTGTRASVDRRMVTLTQDPSPATSPATERLAGLALPLPAIAEAPLQLESLPGTMAGVSSTLASIPVATAPPATARGPATPWGAAANAGVTVGKGSQKAAVATAGFFSRLSTSISSAF